MNKKTYTALFLIGGTIVNLLLILLCVVGLILAAVKILSDSASDVLPTAIPFILIAGIFLGSLLYRRLASFVITKFNLEDNFTPLFRSRRKP